MKFILGRAHACTDREEPLCSCLSSRHYNVKHIHRQRSQSESLMDVHVYRVSKNTTVTPVCSFLFTFLDVFSPFLHKLCSSDMIILLLFLRCTILTHVLRPWTLPDTVTNTWKYMHRYPHNLSTWQAICIKSGFTVLYLFLFLSSVFTWCKRHKHKRSFCRIMCFQATEYVCTMASHEKKIWLTLMKEVVVS